MLPMERTRGKEAFKRIMCYIGVPEEFKDKPCIVIPGTNADKMISLKKVSIGEICRFLGGKWYDIE
jgi:large subunit ribosomal protein L13